MSIFLFDYLSFWYIIAKKPLPNPQLRRFTPMLSSNSFTVLAIEFRSVIHFGKVNFYVWCEERVQSFVVQIYSCPSIISPFLSPFLGTLVEIPGLISGIPIMLIGLYIYPYANTIVFCSKVLKTGSMGIIIFVFIYV